MSMKNKLRRAFDQTKPNVLESILDDCPAPEKTAVRKTRKKLSDRTKEFIATAAALALIISAVGGGFVYYRDYFSSTDPDRADAPGATPPHPSEPSIYPTVPQVTDPLPTVDFDNSVNGLIMRTDDMIYPLVMRDSIYQLPDIPVDLIVEDGIEKYLIRRTDNGYCCEFRFRPSNGELLSIDVIPCECVKESTISPYLATWIASMDLAPQHYGLTQYCEYDWQKSDDGAYLIQAWYLEEYTYVIDAYSGEILDRYPCQPDGKTITWLTARDIALELWDFTMSDVKTLKLAEDGTIYTVYFECGEFAYTVCLDALSGKIPYDSSSEYIGLRADEQMEHLIGWALARDLCLESCGYGLDDLIGFTWEYHSGDPDMYHMELYFPDDGFTYKVNALDGTIPTHPVPEPDPLEKCIGIDAATLIAVGKAGVREDYAAGNVEDLCYKFDDRDPDNLCYWVYFKARGISYEVAVQACTGEVLSLRATGSEQVYSQEDAIQRALDYSHVSREQYVHIECIQLGVKTDRSVYLVIFDNHTYTMVDANTLRVMDVDNPFPTDTIGKSTAAVKALNLIGVETWDRYALVMEGVFNDGYPFYCVEFYDDNLRYLCIVDAYSGEILSTDLSEATLGTYADLAMYAALKHLNLTTEDVTDLAYEYDITTDPEAPRNRIFFTVENLRYEVVVSACYPSHLEILEVHTTDLE